MASTTLPNLPPVLSLLPSALVWINQDGDDFRTTVGAIAGNLIPSLSYATNFLGLGYSGLLATTPFGYEDTNSQPTDVTALDIRGNFTITGGAPGFTQNTVRILTAASAGVATYVWGFLSVLNNSATGGQNVAGYLQGNRMTSGAGETWGGVIEVIEQVAINNPTTGLIGLEIDNRSNGTDSNSQRVIVDAVASRHNESGAATTVAWGYRLQSGSEGANATVVIGFGINAGTVVDVGFDTAQATIVQAAYRMAASQAIWFDSGGVNALSYNGAGLNYTVSAASKVLLGQTGNISAAGQIGLSGASPPAQVTGWGTPTGIGVIANFNGAAATLPQCSEAIAQIITDLKAMGRYAA